MNLIVSLLVLFITYTSSTIAESKDQYPLATIEQKQQFQQLLKQIRCVVCQNQDIADSNAGLAKDLRQQVYTFVKEGKEEKEILAYLSARYGEFILFEPRFAKSTWLLWVAPFVLLILGTVIIVRRSVK